MISMASRKSLAAVVALAATTIQPIVASAQQACVTEDEVSAMAIYSVPNLVQAVRMRCSAQLSSSGFLARRGDSLVGRYTSVQNAVWPRAKAGLLKYGIGKAGARAGSPDMNMLANLPDNAVRPLVDALIVQEASARIQTKHCSRLERVMEAMAPIDPEVAGTLLGLAAGLAAPEDQPICPARRS
jgi:hypothetical protein